jgi:hypothetical protein
MESEGAGTEGENGAGTEGEVAKESAVAKENTYHCTRVAFRLPPSALRPPPSVLSPLSALYPLTAFHPLPSALFLPPFARSPSALSTLPSHN